MIRTIITIDANACNGCGECVRACHEGAIVLENGKAKLLRDDYCDGLGDCLPACPTGAIRFEEREALPYNEAAVLTAMARRAPSACPGSQSHLRSPPPCREREGLSVSCLRQWPVQIRLIPLDAPYFSGADLLVAADCTAFARGDFHERFMRDKITLIGCPKLDSDDYAEKLIHIIARNDLRSVSVARMSVPCCGGIERAVRNAVAASGKTLPFSIAVIAPEGTVT